MKSLRNLESGTVNCVNSNFDRGLRESFLLLQKVAGTLKQIRTEKSELCELSEINKK